MKKLYWLFILLLIVTVGFCIRLYRIDTAPKGALIDELHFGYIANSLFQTGKDEHGASWPIIFKGFGDSKLPGYGYALIPFVAAFGTSIFTIRLPSMLAGTALIALMYWLITELGFSKRAGLLAALIVAVSPWSFFLSRIGFESNLALFFFVIGLAALVKGSRSGQRSWLAVGLASFSLTWYSYIAYRPVTIALIAVWLMMLWLNKKNKVLKQSIFPLIIFVVLLLPLFGSSAFSANSTRVSQVGIFADQGLALQIDENRTFCAEHFPRLLCDAVWNKPILATQTLVRRFYTTFSPEFLVLEGEYQETVFLSVREFAQFYSVLYPFFLIGVVWLATSTRREKAMLNWNWFILAGLIAAAIPALIAGDPQKVRLSPLLPFVIVCIVAGVELACGMFRKKVALCYIGLVLLVGIILGQTTRYLVAYFGVHTSKNDYVYQSYLPDLHSFLKPLDSDNLIVFKPFYSDPLMFYAFYTGMPPSLYQQIAVLGELEQSGFQHTVELGSQAIVATVDPQTAACLALERGKQFAVLVTNEQYDAEVVYSGKSANGVHTYVSVYRTEAADCH